MRTLFPYTTLFRSRILRLVESSRFLRYRVDISRSLTFIEFSRLPRLVESGKFLRYRIEIGRNLRLVDFSRFSRF